MTTEKVDILLVGGGGRENALARALARSPRTGLLLAAPGNPGIAAYAECVPVSPSDVTALVDLAAGRDVGLVVIGPEQPLVDGLADALAERGIAAAGPCAAAARLEGSKVFAKETMRRLGIPQAEPYGVFTDFEEAERYLLADDGPGSGIRGPAIRGPAIRGPAARWWSRPTAWPPARGSPSPATAPRRWPRPVPCWSTGASATPAGG